MFARAPGIFCCSGLISYHIPGNIVSKDAPWPCRGGDSGFPLLVSAGRRRLDSGNSKTLNRKHVQRIADRPTAGNEALPHYHPLLVRTRYYSNPTGVLCSGNITLFAHQEHHHGFPDFPIQQYSYFLFSTKVPGILYFLAVIKHSTLFITRQGRGSDATESVFRLQAKKPLHSGSYEHRVPKIKNKTFSVPGMFV